MSDRAQSVSRQQPTTREYPLWHPFTQMKVFQEYHRGMPEFVGGSGSWLIASDGQRVLDGCSSLWNASIGHGRREVVDAIQRQLNQIAYVNMMECRNPTPVQLAERIVGIAPDGLTRVFLSNTGTSAVEGAILMARQYWHRRGSPQRVTVIGLDRAYHGCSLVTISAGGDPHVRTAFSPLVPGFEHAPPPDCYRCPYGLSYPDCGTRCALEIENMVQRAGPDSVAAIIVEPVLGAAGVLVPPENYLPMLRQICDRYGILLIFDEVATGVGRTGKWFAADRFGVTPDLLVLGKGISGGYLPLSAILISEPIYEAFLDDDPAVCFAYGSTTDGHPVCCAAALATLDVIDKEGLVQRAFELGERMLQRAEALRGCPVVGDVRGCGLMLAIDLVAEGDSRTPLDAEEVYLLHARLLHRGLLASMCESALCLLPPLSVSAEELDSMFEIVEEALWAIES
jgi:taurine-pyruvate aminotransferase